MRQRKASNGNDQQEITFQYRDGYWGKVPAQVVGAAVMDIRSRNGICRPGDLVEAARSPSSLLHPMFDWDDTTAAERYREVQARGAINALRFTIKSRDCSERVAPAFVSVTRQTEEERRGYVPFFEVMSREDYRRQAIYECLRMIRGLQSRYGAYTELALIWSAAQEIQAVLGGASVAEEKEIEPVGVA